MSISIALDNPTGVYRAGAVVSGYVYVQLGEPKTIKKISIEFIGEAKTHWSSNHEEHRDGKSETVTVYCSGARKLLEYRLVLAEGPGKFDLQPGRHPYRFEYQLPAQLPADFEGKFGNIRYSIKANMDVPWGFDINAIQNLKIIPHVDLNTLAIARQGFHLEKEKTIGLCCCSSGTITFTVTAPKSGYICHEVAPFQVQLENNSSAQVYETSIEIIKIIDYTASTPSFEHRSDRSVLVSGKWPTEIGPHGGQHTLNAPLEILPTEPTIVDGSAIIKISYDVEVTCKIRGMHTNKTGRLPIYVGTVPINIPGEPPVPYSPIPTQLSTMAAIPNTMTHIPPNMSYIQPDMSQIPPGMSQIPPGMSQIPPGMSYIPPDMSHMPMAPPSDFNQPGYPMPGYPMPGYPIPPGQMGWNPPVQS